jgi:hypothetical protein
LALLFLASIFGPPCNAALGENDCVIVGETSRHILMHDRAPK